MRAVDLRCEHRTEPLGIESLEPRLRWSLEALPGTPRGVAVAGWELELADTPSALTQGRLRWRRASDATTGGDQQVRYGGPALVPRASYAWRVRVRAAEGGWGPWSAPAAFEVALGSERAAHATWIAARADPAPAPAPILRRALSIAVPVARARLYCCGLGYHWPTIDGTPLDERLLDPPYTRYDRRCLYATFDVTRHLTPGAHVLAVMLGTGWYNVHTAAVWGFHRAPWRGSPRLWCELHLDHADGTHAVVVSDGAWQWADGPVRYDSIYGGQSVDLRAWPAGWNQPGERWPGWQPVVVVPAPGGVLAANPMPPIAVRRELPVRTVSAPAPGVVVLDVGQNAAGHLALRPDLPAGTALRWRYGERLLADGRLDTAAIAQHLTQDDPAFRFQTDELITGEVGTPTPPVFTYHGFQYVELTGAPAGVALERAVARIHHTACASTGSFLCSDPILNRIATLTDWAYISNLQGIPTDCPHREKNGWTGDAHLAAEVGLLTYDSAPFYEKWLQDLADEQRPSGELPGIVPSCGWGYEWGNGPAWDSAFHRIARLLALHLDDATALLTHREALTRYCDYLGTRAKEHLVDIGLGDWVSSGAQTPVVITSTGFYHDDCRIAAEAAAMAGLPAEAERLRAIAAVVRARFRAAYRQPDGRWSLPTQCGLATALVCELCEPQDRPALGAQLVAAVEAARGHLDGGIIAASFVLRALHALDRDDVALRIATARGYPGWAHWIEQGATTLWEQWDGAASRNHIMFGDIVAWMYRALAGLSPERGWRHVRVRPPRLPTLTHAAAQLTTVRGRFAHAWQRTGDTWQLSLTVPVGMTVAWQLPAADPRQVREGDRPLAVGPGVECITRMGDRLEVLVGAGSYDLQIAP